MGMSLDEVPPPGEIPFPYSGTSDDAALADVNYEPTAAYGDVTYANCTHSKQHSPPSSASA